jgi:Peptidase family M23
MHRRSCYGAVFFVALLASAATTLAQTQPPFVLELPVACRLNEECWVVNHVDLDAESGRRDYRCGSMTYDGHKGTDIGIVHGGVDSLTGSTSVLSAAAGTVLGTRDGMRDAGMAANTDAGLQGRECGNGVVLAHDHGWTTQYCHLRQGSVAVRTGERVPAGTKIGDMGMSGLAAFPHVHFQVAKAGRVIDPFVGSEERSADNCAAAPGALWTTGALTALKYPAGQVVSAAWLGARPSDDPVTAQEPELKAWPARGAAYFRAVFLGIARGDPLTVEVKNTAGTAVASNSRVADRPQIRVSLWVRVPERPDTVGGVTGHATIESGRTTHRSTPQKLKRDATP